MLLAYTYDKEIKAEKPFLAIMPDLALDRSARPVPIEKLSICDCAIFYISNQEAVNINKEDNGLIIRPLSGQQFYLTTNLPDRPGLAVKSIKITRDKNQSFLCSYQKDNSTTFNTWTPFKMMNV